MSDAELAEDAGFSKGEECPLCLGKLSPIWDSFEAGRTPCCGKRICKDCVEGKTEYAIKQLKCIRASQDRAEQKQLLQLMDNCPLCRTKTFGNETALLLKNSEQGKGWADYALHFRCAENDASLSAKHLLLSTKRGFPPALYQIANLHSTEEHPEYEFSPIAALEAYARAANSGHARARYEMAWFLIEEKDGGLCKNGEGDVEKAIQIMNLAAEEGYALAYYRLGNIYKLGQYGIEKDDMWSHWYFAKGSLAEINVLDDGIETGFDSTYQIGCYELEQEEKARKLGTDKAASEGIDAYLRILCTSSSHV